MAIFLADFGRGHFVHRVASGASDLLGSSHKLEHGAAIVANDVSLGHGRDALSNAHVSIRQVHEQMLIGLLNLVTDLLSFHF